MEQKLPVMLLKGFLLLPNQEVKVELNNEVSKDLTMLSTKNYNRKLLVVSPMNELEESPEVSDLPEIAVISHIKSRIELPNGNVRMTIKGISRVKILDLANNKENPDILEAKYTKLDLPKIEEVEERALIKKLNDLTSKYVNASSHISNSILANLKTMDNLSVLTDAICSFIPLKFNKKFEYIQEINPLYRAKSLIKDINVELEVIKLDDEIEEELQKSLEESQKEFVLKEKLNIIEQKLGMNNSNQEEYLKTLESLHLASSSEQKIKNEIKKLSYTSDISPENAMIRNYLDWILHLPWKKQSYENNNLEDIKKKLDSSHYGLEEIKNRILEYVALKNNNQEIKSPIICLVGPPGVGKTTIARNIADALNRKFYKISVGGLNDTSELIGHRRTYMGSNPGKFIQGLRKCGTNNPVFLIDEIDKITRNEKDDPTGALLDILDKEQNTEFIDNYIEEPFNLSNILFILTANSLETIPDPLLDRIEIIELSSYTQNEKIEIAKLYLIPRILKEYKITSKIFSMSDDLMAYLIEAYTSESGVRDLSRNLEKIIRKLVVSGKINERTKLSKIRLKEYLGIPKYDLMENNNHKYIGRINALAVYHSGGQVLPLEACIYEGKGIFHISGSLGKVMEESTSVALSYIKSHAQSLNIKDFYFNIKDIHLHFLLAAAKKDGPSAGSAITTCLLSLILNKKIDNNIALTGEISLNGDILKVGGIKEKLIGAYNNNIKTVFIPYANEPDLEMVPKVIKEKLDIHLVKNYMEIYKELF